MKLFILAILSFWAGSASAQKASNWVDGRNTIVHMFEWKYTDIAQECENFLNDKKYAGVQISPPAENVVVYTNTGRPWWEKYQPVSYILDNRGGNQEELADMIKRCNSVGVRVYVDLVVNHMAAMNGTGTHGSAADPTSKSYPAVPYNSENFHATCGINWQDVNSIRNCELEGLKDLDQSQDYVRQKIKDYMNALIDMGVAGFRVDAAKHMWPEDLSAIFGSLNDLNNAHGFSDGARALIYQEVVDTDPNDIVPPTEYTDFGRICEFKHGDRLSQMFRGHASLKDLRNWGTQFGLLDESETVTFIDNHDTQRSGALYYINGKNYRAGVAFMLAHPYDGLTRIMSSYEFNGHDQGPPQNGDDIISPEFASNGSCTNGWVCEHRWNAMYNMVEFREVVRGTELTNWWDNGDQQIAFSRGDKGFYVANVSGDLNQSIATSLPSGTYCDIISGSLVDGQCTGKTLVVENGQVNIQINSGDSEACIATHVNAKL